MTVIPPPATVLVTGANGYIGSWITKVLLEAGYSVTGTVRSAAKGEDWAKLYAEDEKAKGKEVKFVVVEDITVDGAFDDAVKGVHAIVHTASPVVLNHEDDPRVIIDPAIKGTVGILESALKFGSNVKRVVSLSSAAAVLSLHPKPRTFSEVDWNDQAVEQVKKEGKDAPGIAKYRASKTLAEKASWEFMEKNKKELEGRFDLVAFAPPFVFGPQLHTLKLSKPEEMTFSSLLLYKALILGDFHIGKPTIAAGLWVDVRDIAQATLLALREKEEAGGERVIVSAGEFIWQDFLDALHNTSPPPFPPSRVAQLPKGEPGTSGKDVVHPILYDTTKQCNVLGLEPRGIEECVRDTVADYQGRGW